MGRVLGSFSVALITLFSIATGGDYPGIIGGTIELVLQQNFTDRGKEVVWKFNNGTKPFKLVAKFKDNKLETGHLQFQNHLEILRDANGLRITNLTLNYRGTYIAKITLDNHSVYEESFIVSLYDPLPAPSIRIDYETGASVRCKVIVHCDVPANTISNPVSYTWIYRYDSSDYKHHNNTGNTIEMFLQPESSEVMCIIQNPADSKNASAALKACQQKETPQNRLHWCLGFVVLVVLLLGVVFLIFCKKENKPRDASQTCCKEELKYSVPESNTKLLPDTYKDPEENLPFFDSDNIMKCSKLDFIPVHYERQLLQYTIAEVNIELGVSDHPSFPVPEHSENEEEC